MRLALPFEETNLLDNDAAEAVADKDERPPDLLYVWQVSAHRR
jgi:hypothetical protein